MIDLPYIALATVVPLLLLPVYRLIHEPLRAYLLYASLLQAPQSTMIGWYEPERTHTVHDLTTGSTTAQRA